jgi:hypothetical protein
MNFTRKVSFTAAYDKRDPNPSKNYGIHGVHIYFTLSTEDKEGLTFSISTNWQLPHVQAETDSRPPPPSDPYLFYKPMSFGVDYHSHRPQYEGHHCTKNCHVTGGDCYSDGSALLGEEFLQTLISGGDEALWKRMEEQFLRWMKPLDIPAKPE